MQQLVRVQPQLHSPCRLARATVTSACTSKAASVQASKFKQLNAHRASFKRLALPELTLERLDTASLSPEPQASVEPRLLSEERLLQGCEPERAPLHVALLLSGGVDSSVALHLAKRAGHRVTAYYLQIWFEEDFRNYWDSCPWEDDLQYCQQVCKDAGVELHTVPLTKQYWDRVVSHSISEIKAGRTPNPDVLCNSRVKFGAFYEYLATQQTHKHDRIASGHYACLIRQDDPDLPVQLALAPDAVKDQTYFLAHLTQQQLAKVMFPLGHLTKAEVRAHAKAAGLPNQARRDSQGICFLGKVKFTEFVKEHLGVWPGCIIEQETGEVIGYHQGFWFHTVGQRKGIPLSGGPWYVTEKNVDTNTVYVSRDYYSIDKERSSFVCKGINWIASLPDLELPVSCKVRHGPFLYQCKFSFLLADDQRVALVQLHKSDQGLASGQYAVFYQDEICLGSGVIETF